MNCDTDRSGSERFSADHATTYKRLKATEVISRAIAEGKVMPASREMAINDLCKFSNENIRTFSQDGSKTPFETECERLLTRTKDKRFSEQTVSRSASRNRVGGGGRPVNLISETRRRELLAQAGEPGRTAIRRIDQEGKAK
jgi:hypothetical protein